jgi:hypothetical protein
MMKGAAGWKRVASLYANSTKFSRERHESMRERVVLESITWASTGGTWT